jgi:serine protease Do
MFFLMQMIGRLRVWLLLIGLCQTVFATIVTANVRQPDFQLPMDETPLNREHPTRLTSYAPVIAPAKEAVVSVHTARVVRVARSQRHDLRDDFFRRFFGLPPMQQQEQQQPDQIEERRVPAGIGSGVAISADGFILTNNHVIADPRRGNVADEILVRLNDGRELPAQVVGRDPRTDVAVLKVEADNLPFLRMAQSDDLQVGDIVFAIGNPLGVGLTITKGIVSATGRSNLSILGEDAFEDFIQTDASINQGNSGGALIDAEGRLIGINTAILSRTGGNIGIGFAIPSTLARNIATALIRTGEIRRGVMGIQVNDLTPDLAEAFGVTSLNGALVEAVTPDLPADTAGIRNGDIITAINGQPIRNAAALRVLISQLPVGVEMHIELIRNTQPMVVTTELIDPTAAQSIVQAGQILPGVHVKPLNETLQAEFNISQGISGLVITEVESNSPFVRSLRAGMVIREINGRAPTNLDEARELLSAQSVSRVYLYDRGRSAFYALRP